VLGKFVTENSACHIMCFEDRGSRPTAARSTRCGRRALASRLMKPRALRSSSGGGARRSAMWTDLIQASVQKSGTQWSSQLLSFGCRRLGLQFASSTIQKPLVWRPRAALRTSLSRFFGSPPHPVALWHILKRWCLCKDLLLSIVCNAPGNGILHPLVQG